MRIQYASDLHLELWQKTTFDETLEPTAPYLVLNGDIANLNTPNLRAFLEYVSERWKYIFWIPGNSEIWENSKSEEISLNKMRELCSPYRNIKILYKSSFLLKENDEKILVVGVSLWHKPRDGIMLHHSKNIYIKPIPPPCETKIFAEAHKSQVEYLTYVIKNSEIPLLICSYYAPFTWYYEQDWIQEPKSALIDRELEKIITFPIVSWIVGHVHLPIEYTRRYFLTDGSEGNVLFVSNPRGKPKQNPYYRKEAVINLKPNLLIPLKEEEIEPIWALKAKGLA
jgi:hypothetical protein